MIEEAEILLNRQLCIHPSVWSNIKNGLTRREIIFRRRVETGQLTKDDLDNFTRTIEKAELLHEQYIGWIKRIEKLKREFSRIPGYAADDYKRIKKIRPTDIRFNEIDFDKDGNYVSGKLDKLFMYKIETGVYHIVSKCYHVYITLIMIRRFRQSALSVFPKEIVHMIAKEVWKTRFEDVWFK